MVAIPKRDGTPGATAMDHTPSGVRKRDSTPRAGVRKRDGSPGAKAMNRLEEEEAIAHSVNVHCRSGHILRFIGTRNENGWMCHGVDSAGGCRSGISGYGQTQGMNRFRCKQCDYDLCENCAAPRSNSTTASEATSWLHRHRWLAFTALFCAIICALDALFWLPHPVAEPPGAEGAVRQSAKHGLPSAVIRQRYNKRLEEWAKTADQLRKNPTKVEALPVAVNVTLGRQSAICQLAAASVAERHAARVEARLHGSVLSHIWLILRDLCVYRSFDAFTLQKMMKQKKNKLIKSGKKSVTVDEVCDALVGSSTTSNEAYNNFAESSQGVGYMSETALMYCLPSLVIMVLVYVIELIKGKARNTAKTPEEARVEEGSRSSRLQSLNSNP